MMAPGLQFPWNCQIKVKDLGYFCRLVPTIEVRSRLTMVVWCPIRPSQPSLCVRFCEPISVVLDHISSRTSVFLPNSGLAFKGKLQALRTRRQPQLRCSPQLHSLTGGRRESR